MTIGCRIRTTPHGAQNRTPAFPGHLNREAQGNAKSVISQVTAGNVWGQVGTFVHGVGFRADRQPPPPDAVNIHIQMNGVDNPSTVACVIIPACFNIGFAAMNMLNPKQVPEIQRRIDQSQRQFRELTHQIRRALNQSMASIAAPATVGGNHTVAVFEIHGEFSN